MFVVRIMFVLVFLQQVTASGSGCHSLWVLASYISGNTMFPQFTLVLMLDDIQVAYFDSVTNRMTRNSSDEEKLDLGAQAMWVIHDISANMRYRLGEAKQRLNLTTGGVHVQQWMAVCEVEDDEPVLSLFRDSCNRNEEDSVMYNMTHFTYTGREGWDVGWGSPTRAHAQTLHTNVYLPICVRILKFFLVRENKQVMRRVKPRVRFMSKQVTDGTLLTCMATDFYPRHINLTLLRDGQPVDETELSVGQVLPNGNGLYQLRKTLTITHKALYNKHSYTCTASHLSLKNRLEVKWRAEFSRSHRIQILSAPFTIAIVLSTILLLLWCRKRILKGSEGVAVEILESLNN